MRPTEEEYAPYYKEYIAIVDGDVWSLLREQAISFPGFIRNIPAGREQYAYAPEKWTLKEVIGHVLDTERIMAYRLLRIARKDRTPLAGFDEKSYVANARTGERSLERLAGEFNSIRESNLYLFEALNEEELGYTGQASGYGVSVRALLYIIAGHLQHHKRVIEKRYL